MRQYGALVIVVGCACAIGTSSPRRMLAAAIDRVELDVVAIDHRGGTVEGLRPDDFEVREDDTSPTVNSVVEVGSRDVAAPRVVVLVLDDTSIPPNLTARVQRIATLFVNRAAPGDRVNVVRFSRPTDEAVGNPAAARARIADYRSGIVPFFGRETLENALEQVVKLSRQFEPLEPRRRTIVAIGSPSTFDVEQPIDGRGSLLWRYWVDAVSAAARANVNVSVIDPAGTTGRVKIMSRFGLVERTGGQALYNSGAYESIVDQIWRAAGHYYILSYTPASSRQDLHDVQVRVRRKGIHVRARTART